MQPFQYFQLVNLVDTDMPMSSNHAEISAHCCHGKHTVANLWTLLSDLIWQQWDSVAELLKKIFSVCSHNVSTVVDVLMFTMVDTLCTEEWRRMQNIIQWIDRYDITVQRSRRKQCSHCIYVDWKLSSMVACKLQGIHSSRILFARSRSYAAQYHKHK
jgi:hypothetical protein